MNEALQFRFNRIRARQMVADQRYEEMFEAREKATSRYFSDPSEANRQAVLVALRDVIEALEDLLSLDLHVAELAKGHDPEWDKAAVEAIEVTEMRLVINYAKLQPGGGFGFTLNDL